MEIRAPAEAFQRDDGKPLPSLVTPADPEDTVTFNVTSNDRCDGAHHI